MRLTWEGRRFLLATFLIAVAALNTGNNLIYLILSLMVAFLLISFAILRQNLSGVAVSASCEPPVYAGQPAAVTLEARNSKRLVPSFSLRIASESGTTAYCPKIAPRQTVVTELTVTFAHRGYARYRSFSVACGFPFILLEMRRPIDVKGSVLVYPAMAEVGELGHRLAAAGGSGMMKPTKAGEELFGIRQFREGDDWRNIHWKATARSGSLLVREFALHAEDRVTVYLENIAPLDGALFERAVSLAASVARHFLAQGFCVGFLDSSGSTGFGTGDEQLWRILDRLAVTEPVSQTELGSPDLPGGFSVAVLVSPAVTATAFAASCDLVLYADTI